MRSCEACIKAKTRCDNARPCCARCASRHVPCAYSMGIRMSKVSDKTSLHQKSYQDIIKDKGVPDALSTRSSIETTEPIEGAADLLDFSFANQGFGLPDWGLPHSDFSLMNEWGPFVPLLPQSGQRDGRMDLTPMVIQAEGQTIPRMPNYHLRSFTQSRSITGRVPSSAKLMTQMLTSFPRTMYNPGSLPPFIHPYSLGTNSHNPDKGFESLTTCMTLMQMVSSGAPSNRKLFWKNVRLECERLQVEVPFFSFHAGCHRLTIRVAHFRQVGFTLSDASTDNLHPRPTPGR
jgi:hypothetical protein